MKKVKMFEGLVAEICLFMEVLVHEETLALLVIVLLLSCLRIMVTVVVEGDFLSCFSFMRSYDMVLYIF